MKAKRKTTTTRRKADPIFAAIAKYDRAYAALMDACKAHPNRDPDRKFGEACFEAECRVAETKPTTLAGLHAASRWVVAWVKRCGGPGYLHGHHALDTWPATMERALRRLAREARP